MPKNYFKSLQIGFLLLFIFLIFLSCTKPSPLVYEPNSSNTAIAQAAKSPGGSSVRLIPVDRNATFETKNLLNNLKKISKTNTLFGHQDDTKTGYGWENRYNPDNPNEPYIQASDVKRATGVYPAVFGWDYMRIVDFYTGNNKAWETKITRDLTIDAYNRGAINTYSWHYHNPIAKEGIWWEQAPVEAVKHILPGGSHHGVFKNSLRELADYNKTLIGADGKLIPIIFRPFHEMNGDWFWWGRGHCTVQEYKSLYQFTVKYLRDSLGVHNFLYAWTPDQGFATEAKYLEFYPGDAYVDIVGMDSYADLFQGKDPNIAGSKLKIVSDYAIRKNKVAAFTETGLNKIPQADWFTKMLLPVLRNKLPEVAYVMLWSNTTDMYWTPYANHVAEENFRQFASNPFVLFNRSTPSMYNF